MINGIPNMITFQENKQEIGKSYSEESTRSKPKIVKSR